MENYPLTQPDVMADMLRDLEHAVTHACLVIDALRQDILELRAERDALLERVVVVPVKKGKAE